MKAEIQEYATKQQQACMAALIAVFLVNSFFFTHLTREYNRIYSPAECADL